MTETAKNTHWTASRIAGLGLLTAVVILLQLMGSFIHFGPFSVSLVLIPIVVGSALYGITGGAWLGLVFGVVVLLSGDASLFLAVSAGGTIITVIVKGICAGLAAGAVYEVLSHINPTLAIAAAACVCPVVNTGVFLIGCLIFFMDTVAGWAAAAGLPDQVGKYMIIGLVGGNFIFELLTNVILSPIIVRVIKIVRTRVR